MRVHGYRNLTLALAIAAVAALATEASGQSDLFSIRSPSGAPQVRLPWRNAPDEQVATPDALPSADVTPSELTSIPAERTPVEERPSPVETRRVAKSVPVTGIQRSPELLDAPPTVASNPVTPPPAAPALKPIPDAVVNPDAAPEVFAASFNGVTPGESTAEDVQAAFGPPVQATTIDGQTAHLNSIEGFEHIEVHYDADNVVTSLMIRLPQPVDARQFAGAMPHLKNIEPVMVCDEMGYVLGQSFPERGVLCSFEPSEAPNKASMKVVQVIFETISAESFLLRAEATIDTSWKQAQRDLSVVTDLEPLNARAHWLLARIYLLQGDYTKALASSTRAVQIDANDPQYYVTQADILRQLSRVEEAIEQAQIALPLCENRPHVKARTMCLIGDLLSTGPMSDYVKAYQFHYAAIQTAEPLVDSPHPAIRVAAKEVLIDAHLGAAHDIAWGEWDQKELAVPRWLEQAQGYADDLIDSERRGEEPRFRIATRALACFVGMQGQLDPSPWIQEVERVGRKLIESTSDPERKCQHQWNIGLVLFDAVQIYQMRKEYAKSMKYGEQAVDYLEQGIQQRNGFADAYILARLYFRLGVIQAIGMENHQVAVSWFERALPIFNQSADHISAHELGRFGETFVSMGVSFWQAGQQERAVDLTERGVKLIDLGVEREVLPMSKLETPYSNLAIMLRKLGRDDEADHYFDLALRTKQSGAAH